MTKRRPDGDRLHSQITEAEARLAELDKERAALVCKLSQFWEELAESEASRSGPPVTSPGEPPRSKHGKVSLFRSLFTGRVDLFPRL